MKKLITSIFLGSFLAACVAGKFTPERNRLHEMGRVGVCETNPSRCVEGTDIDW